MQIIYQPSGINNFHNAAAVKLRVPATALLSDPIGTGDMYEISPRQARRLREHFCGITDCRCPGGAIANLNFEGTRCGVPTAYVR